MEMHAASPKVRLDVVDDRWRLAISTPNGRPEVDMSPSMLRLQLPGGSVSEVPVPSEALPLDLEAARCSFSRKRGELCVEWPRQAVQEKLEAEGATAAEAPAAAEEAPASEQAPAAAEEAAAEEAPVEPEAPVTEEAPVEEVAPVDEAPAEPLRSAEEWKSMGNDAVKAGDLEEAVRCYSEGLKAGGGDEAMLRSNRALCFSKLARHEESFEDASRCVALRPDFFKGYLRGAMALRALKRFEEALSFLKRCPPNDEASALAAELRPEAEAAEAARIASLSGAERAKEEGNVLFRKGLFEPALEKYSEALGKCEEPEGKMALAIRNNRAACFHQISDFSAVIKDASFVLEREPENLKALTRRMLALEPLEKYEAALSDARAVLRQDPRSDVANKVQHRLSKLVRDLQRAGSS